MLPYLVDICAAGTLSPWLGLRGVEVGGDARTAISRRNLRGRTKAQGRKQGACVCAHECVSVCGGAHCGSGRAHIFVYSCVGVSVGGGLRVWVFVFLPDSSKAGR